MNQEKRYRAVMIAGFDCWVWFEETAITEKDNRFTGLCGWSENMFYTVIEVSSYNILKTCYITGMMKNLSDNIKSEFSKMHSNPADYYNRRR